MANPYTKISMPMNLINWFIDLSLEDKIKVFNYISKINLKKINLIIKKSKKVV